MQFQFLNQIQLYFNLINKTVIQTMFKLININYKKYIKQKTTKKQLILHCTHIQTLYEYHCSEFIFYAHGMKHLVLHYMYVFAWYDSFII